MEVTKSLFFSPTKQKIFTNKDKELKVHFAAIFNRGPGAIKGWQAEALEC